MQAILNNPFRLLGVLADATARDIYRQSSIINKFLIADQMPLPDYSFPQLGVMDRSIERIDAAVAELNLDEDKMTAALFWFYKGYDLIDEPVIEALKEGNIAMAKSVWENLVIETGEDGKKHWKNITSKNYSAFHNWFVLEFSEKPGWSFIANIKFLESDFYTDLQEKVTHSTFTITRKELQINFLNTILKEIENGSVNFSMNEFIITLNNEQFSAKQDFLKNVSQKLVTKLSLQTEVARKQRTVNGANAGNAGETLCKQTENDLELLKSIIEVQNFTYSEIADKVADEILQCGTDYFNYYKNSSTNPEELAMNLYQKAIAIASGLVCQQQCEEKIKNLQEWIENAPEREKQKKIENSSNAIVKLLGEFEQKPYTIANAKSLINQSKRYLDTIRNVLGASDPAYLAVSTKIASQAQYCIIEEVNRVQNGSAEETQLPNSQSSIIQLRKTLIEAWDAVRLLGSLDMESNFLVKYTSNKASLKDMCNKLEVSTMSSYVNQALSYPPTPSKLSWILDNFGNVIWLIIGVCLLVLLYLIFSK